LGNGDGSFRIAQSAITGNEPFAITTGRFSHDGKSDLAVANLASNNVSILDRDVTRPQQIGVHQTEDQ